VDVELELLLTMELAPVPPLLVTLEEPVLPEESCPSPVPEPVVPAEPDELQANGTAAGAASATRRARRKIRVSRCS
jgi:hypothetical protein